VRVHKKPGTEGGAPVRRTRGRQSERTQACRRSRVAHWRLPRETQVLADDHKQPRVAEVSSMPWRFLLPHEQHAGRSKRSSSAMRLRKRRLSLASTSTRASSA
jgi:hypothetical protein